MDKWVWCGWVSDGCGCGCVGVLVCGCGCGVGVGVVWVWCGCVVVWVCGVIHLKNNILCSLLLHLTLQHKIFSFSLILKTGRGLLLVSKNNHYKPTNLLMF